MKLPCWKKEFDVEIGNEEKLGTLANKSNINSLKRFLNKNLFSKNSNSNIEMLKKNNNSLY